MIQELGDKGSSLVRMLLSERNRNSTQIVKYFENVLLHITTLRHSPAQGCHQGPRFFPPFCSNSVGFILRLLVRRHNIQAHPNMIMCRRRRKNQTHFFLYVFLGAKKLFLEVH